MTKHPIWEEHTMDIDREDRIRIRAHEIWEREGKPFGRGEEHWERAGHEVEAEQNSLQAGSGSATILQGEKRNQRTAR